jgi:cytochrome c oxidase subunit 2
VYNEAVHPPEDAPEIFIVGKQWMWKIQYPGGQRVIVGANTATFTEQDWRDAGVLILPVGRPVKITGTSEDVIHSVGVPAFRMKMDVLPGRYTSTWWHPTKVGEYHFFCDQYCGTQHSQMVGKVRVVEQAEYDQWLNERAEGSLALEGRKLFLKLQCLGCHSNDAEARAPVLEALYRKRVPLKGGGSVVADESYIRESILKPRAKVVEGWEAIMPAYQGQVTEEDLIKVIAYIRSLQPGDLKDANVVPVRTEQFPPPVGAPTQPSEGVSPK